MELVYLRHETARASLGINFWLLLLPLPKVTCADEAHARQHYVAQQLPLGRPAEVVYLRTFNWLLLLTVARS